MPPRCVVLLAWLATAGGLSAPAVRPRARRRDAVKDWFRRRPLADAPAPARPPRVDTRIGRAGTPAVLKEEEVCLMPGEVVVRVEDAPGNARRIFTGIDILADVDTVWDILNDYERLSDVVPNLVKNEVLSRDADGLGGRMKQVGAAKLLPGVSFKAALTLDVRAWPDGMPASMTAATSADDPLVDAASSAPLPSSAEVRARDAKLPLRRGVFPRPYAVTKLPIRDISMQSVEGAPGDFRLYQGVWRLQCLSACAPGGQSATRLTYAVELSPSLPVPVRLLEGKIANDLTGNLQAIRAFAERAPTKRAADAAGLAVRGAAAPGAGALDELGAGETSAAEADDELAEAEAALAAALEALAGIKARRARESEAQAARHAAEWTAFEASIAEQRAQLTARHEREQRASSLASGAADAAVESATARSVAALLPPEARSANSLSPRVKSSREVALGILGLASPPGSSSPRAGSEARAALAEGVLALQAGALTLSRRSRGGEEIAKEA